MRLQRDVTSLRRCRRGVVTDVRDPTDAACTERQDATHSYSGIHTGYEQRNLISVDPQNLLTERLASVQDRGLILFWASVDTKAAPNNRARYICLGRSTLAYVGCCSLLAARVHPHTCLPLRRGGVVWGLLSSLFLLSLSPVEKIREKNRDEIPSLRHCGDIGAALEVLSCAEASVDLEDFNSVDSVEFIPSSSTNKYTQTPSTRQQGTLRLKTSLCAPRVRGGSGVCVARARAPGGGGGHRLLLLGSGGMDGGRAEGPQQNTHAYLRLSRRVTCGIVCICTCPRAPAGPHLPSRCQSPPTPYRRRPSACLKKQVLYF